MPKSLKQLLSEADDNDLCSGLFHLIVEQHGNEIDASAI